MFENEFNSNSISQGKLFKSQTNTRILKGKNRVSLGGSYMNDSKMSVNTIEPFTVSKQVNELNRRDNDIRDTIITDINSAVKDSTNASNNTSTIAKTFVNVDGKSSLKNKNITTEDSIYGAVNNMGIFSKYADQTSSANQINAENKPVVNTTINLSNSINNSTTDSFPILRPDGDQVTSDVALLGQSTSLSPNSQSIVGKYAGKNVYVSEPKPFDISNLNFDYSFTGSNGLEMQEDLSNVSVEQCIRRAVDNAGSSAQAYASITNNGNVVTKNGVTGVSKTGQCYVGTKVGDSKNSYTKEFILMNVFNNKNNASVTDAGSDQTSNSSNNSTNITNRGVKIKGILFFGSDGGLYNGTADSKYNNLISNLPNDIKENVDPIFGSTINSVTASYGQNLGTSNTNNMLIDDTVANNSNINGRASARLNTIRSTTTPVVDCNWPDAIPWFLRDPNNFLGKWYCPTINIPSTSPILSTSDLVTYLNNIGLPQNTDIIYNCGKKTFKIDETNISAGASFPIDCSSIMSKYGPFILIIGDDGIITVTNLADNTVVWTTNKSIKPTVVKSKWGDVTLNAPRPDWVNQSASFTYNGTKYYGLLADGVTQAILTPGNFISSPNGYSRLYLTPPDANGISMLQVQYSLYEVTLDNDGYLIGDSSNSFAQYSISNLDSSNVGQLSYIDLNNNLFNYKKPANGYTLDDANYTKVDYKPSKFSIGSVTTNLNDCRIRCTSDSDCAGYSFDNNTCTLYKINDIFPNGNRIYSPTSENYIKKVKITDDMNNNSCSKEVDIVDSSTYSYFPNKNPGNMDPNMKCGLGVVIDQQMQNLQNKNNIAVTKGNVIKDQVNNVFLKNNKIINDIKNNTSNSGNYINESNKIKKQIGKIENTVFTSQAAESDSELLSITDNYRYITWGIITVLITIGTVKAFRVGTT